MEKFKNTLKEDDVKEAALKAGAYLTHLNEFGELSLSEFTKEINKVLENILRDI